MLAALVLLNLFHPGRVMPGKESNLPTRKQRKRGIRSKADRLEELPESNKTQVVGGEEMKVFV